MHLAARPIVERLSNIQHLRALAALTVLIGHAAGRTIAFAHGGLRPIWLPSIDAGFGVSVFFVISGFIMYYTTSNSWARAGATQAFMSRRLARIVPIYWILTLIEGLILFLSRLDEPARQLTTGDWIRSLAFIPYLNEFGKFRPILGVGWTLDYEMMFYTIFAIALVFQRAAGLAFLVVVFGSLILIGPWAGPEALKAWSQPVILEFLIGVGIGVWYVHMRGTLGEFNWPALAIALALVVFQNVAGIDRHLDDDGLGWRFATWFLAALVVLVGVISRQSIDRTPIGKAATSVGDSSYSLYLSHPITISMFEVALAKSHLSKLMPDWLYFLASITVAIAAAWYIYIVIERPITHWLSKRLRNIRLAGARPTG